MRTLFTSLIIAIVLFSGCKKETKAPSANTYLLKTVTYTTNPAAFTFVDQYSYDSKNRVIEFNSQTQLRDYKYTYDDNNNLTSATVYDTGVGGRLNSIHKFTYSANQIIDDEVDSTNFPLAHWVFTLNDKQQVTFLSSDLIEYTYDGNGNITGYNETGTLKQSDSYTYDNKKHPLSMIGAKNVHLMFLTGFGFTNVNNIVHDNINTGDYTYTYNDAGFPTTRTGLDITGRNQNIATYSYVTK